MSPRFRSSAAIGRPARRNSTLVRLGRFLRRHPRLASRGWRVAVGVGMALAGLVVGAVVILVFG